MSFKVFIHPKAEKQLGKIPEGEKIREKLKSLVNFPDVRNVVRVQGSKSTYRLRIGRYRALFEVFKNEKIIVVAKVDVRGRIYK
jgi:mRNA interferase RelE/StbE